MRSVGGSSVDLTVPETAPFNARALHAARREQSTTLVVLATYNERENLPVLLRRLRHAADVDVLVVDDNSPDGTGKIADRWAALDPRISVMHRETKAGLPSAITGGFRYAMERGYDAVVEMDADLSHPPEDLPAILDAIAKTDVVIGSRRAPGGRIVGRARWRNALTNGACRYARFILRLTMRDCTSGYRCIRTSALQRIDFDGITSKGYGFLIELDWALERSGSAVVEVPITFRDRTHGRSKMSMPMIFEALLIVLKLRLGFVRAATKARPEPGDLELQGSAVEIAESRQPG